ncbi:predicted protein [Micromonas commoda]|uniref:Uncharacterized protein n=1 Tax=Micromonas commoda (strain RCC299 / NOUM17 / CCMP2709) TaxID=296587 RepID=C1DYY8_MICCC|nr:predicted protein [Micromonas commoda]ACO61512.1 predicted protein [Micromonas commoda]|eukprot:XP_002500254.1 predicted protein [Micromonas commoda]
MLKATIAHTTAVSIRQAGNSSGKIIAWESVLNVSSAKCCLQKFLASIDARLQLPPRRLHTARIDVKLCEDVADDARLEYWSQKCESFRAASAVRKQPIISTQVALVTLNLESYRVWSYDQILSKIFVDRPNIPACALYSHGSWSAPKNSLRSRTPGTHSRARERAQLEGTRRTLANLFQTLNPTSDDRRA